MFAEGNKNKYVCWECEAKVEYIEHHHPVPRSRGGKKTIPLCSSCHSKAHHRGKNMNIGKLTSAALQAKIAGGWKAGNPELSKLSKKGNEAMRSKADRFALEIKSVVDGLRANGCNTFNGMAFEMNRAGVKTARGGEWSAQTVKRLVKRLEALEVKNAGEK